MTAPRPKVVVAGVGALGSHVCQFLRNEAIDLRVIDFDRVARKNVLSQFHGLPGVGKTKVESLRQTMSYLYGTKMSVLAVQIGTHNVHEMLGGSTLVLDCLDNGQGRRLIQSYVRERAIPCLHGALAADGAFGRVVWDADFRIDDEVPGAATCEDGQHLPFIALVSSCLAYAAQRWLAHGQQVSFSIHPGGAIRT